MPRRRMSALKVLVSCCGQCPFEHVVGSDAPSSVFYCSHADAEDRHIEDIDRDHERPTWCPLNERSVLIEAV